MAIRIFFRKLTFALFLLLAHNASAGQWLSSLGGSSKSDFKEMIALYPQVATHLVPISEDASHFARWYPKDENRVRHLTWSTWLTVYFGEKVAQGIGDIHEGNPIVWGIQDYQDSYIDEANNRTGRALGRKMLQEGWGRWINGGNWFSIRAEIHRRVLQYVAAHPHQSIPWERPASLVDATQRKAQPRPSSLTH